MWPSTVGTVSASAISRITWLNPTPHRLAVYASAAPLPVAPATLATRRLATPYLGGTCPRWIALASPSAHRLSSEARDAAVAGRGPEAIGAVPSRSPSLRRLCPRCADRAVGGGR